MTDGEKARIKEAFTMFQVAVKQTSPQKCMGVQSIENLVYTFICMALGWALEEKVYTENLEEHIRRIRSQGVEPASSIIEKR